MTQASRKLEEARRLSIFGLLREAIEAAKAGDRARALELCEDAWNYTPEPRYGWDVTYACLDAAVKCLRITGHYDRAIQLVEGYLESGYFLEYQDGPDFWLGTLHFEKGSLDEAYRYLEAANRISRGRCFVEEDPRFKAFFKTFKSGKT